MVKASITCCLGYPGANVMTFNAKQETRGSNFKRVYRKLLIDRMKIKVCIKSSTRLEMCPC